MEPTLDNGELKKEIGGVKFTEVSDADQEFLTKQLGNKWGSGHSWESPNDCYLELEYLHSR